MTRKRKKKVSKKRGGAKKDKYKFDRIKPKERTKEEVEAIKKKFNDKHGSGAYDEMTKNPMIFWKKKVEEKKEEGKKKMREKLEYATLESSILDAIKEQNTILQNQRSNRNRNITQKLKNKMKSIFGRKSRKRRRKKTRKKRRKKKKINQ
tara:strand:+ start:5203 stop:5652 length:450 start_codon:yes stop_codon:yes gene_type:complete